MGYFYKDLAQDLRKQIEQGLYLPGQRLPGVRELGKQRSLSIATVLAAYRLLEDDGYLEPKSRSGFFVKARREVKKIEPLTVKADIQPCTVSGQEIVLAMSKAATDPNCVKLGAAVPAPNFLPVSAVEKALAAAAKRRERIFNYELAGGAPELRLQIARRMAETGYVTTPEDIIVTNGCQEALTIALKATTKPGDVIAIETPTFYGLLQVIDSLGLKPIEIPTDPVNGISLEAMQLALESFDLKACVLIPNFSNPLGYLMSDQRKLALIKLLAEKNVPLIEDDTYGDLGFSSKRPHSFLALSPHSNIIYCSTYSKTLSPDLRVGWIVAPHYKKEVEYLKFVSNLASSSVSQLAVADILGSGKYERYVRNARVEYSRSVDRMLGAIERYFPSDTRVSEPKGGFVLWVEMPDDINSFVLAGNALKQGVSIAPGPVFSPTQRYQNFMRISCARLWDARMESALKTLGKLMVPDPKGLSLVAS